MGTWYIGAKDEKKVYEACDIMQQSPAECDDVGRDEWISFLRSNGRWSDEICGTMPIEEIFLDGGGMVTNGEPRINWTANGCSFRTFVRHVPFLLDAMKRKQPNRSIPKCIALGGFHRVHFFALETVAASIIELERLLKGTESLRQELEIDMQRAMNEAAKGGRAGSARKCGCMSGLEYGDCCGKHVETPAAKKMRKMITEGDRP